MVATEKGFHVLRLKARMPAHALPLDDVKMQIRNRLYSERRTAANDALMTRLKTEAGYTLDEAALAADLRAGARRAGHAGRGLTGMGDGRACRGGPRGSRAGPRRTRHARTASARRAASERSSRIPACAAAGLLLLAAGCHRRPPRTRAPPRWPG